MEKDIISEADLKKAKEDLGHAKLLWFIHKIQSYGFWALIVLGVGAMAGITYVNRENVKNTDNITITGSFIHKGVLYDVSARPIQPTQLLATQPKTNPTPTTK